MANVLLCVVQALSKAGIMLLEPIVQLVVSPACVYGVCVCVCVCVYGVCTVCMCVCGCV